MVQEIVIASFILVSLHEMMGGGGLLTMGAGWEAWALAAAPTLVLCGWSHLWIAALGRRLDRSGDVRAVYLAERIMLASRLFALALLAFNVLALDWVGMVQGVVGRRVLIDTLLSTSPVLITMLAGWWWFYPIEVRLREASLVRSLDEGREVQPTPSRGGYVFFWARHSMIPALLPIVCITTWVETLEHAWAWSPGLRSMGEGARIGIQILGIAVFLGAVPLMLRYVWDTTVMPAGEVRERLEAVCKRNGVRVREHLLWRTGGTIHNAAVLGIIARARFILVTDAMMAHMPGEYLEAVAAHEVGHVRLRHLAWLAMATLASVLASVVSLAWGAGLLLYWAMALPWVERHFGGEHGWTTTQTETIRGLFEMGVSLGSLVGAFVVFGWVSRRFEWQADAFAARDLSRASGEGEHVTSAGCECMRGALSRVAAYNGIPLGKFMWRHGSIRTRQVRLLRLVGARGDAMPIDRDVRVIKWITLVVLLAMIAMAVLKPELVGIGPGDEGPEPMSPEGERAEALLAQRIGSAC